MSSKAPAAPPPPDPVATAKAQSEYNLQAAQENAKLNRVNQYTPQGSSVWTAPRGSQGWDEQSYLTANPDVANSGLTGEQHYERYGRTENRQGVAQGYQPASEWEQTVSLSPEQQKLYDQSIAGQTLYGDAALSQLRGVQDTLSRPFQFDGPALQSRPDFTGIGDPNQSRDAVQEALMARINPDLERERAALESRLANQGITMGSQAWNTGMQDYSRMANDARFGAVLNAGQEQTRMFGLGMGQAQLGNAARQQSLEQQLALRAQPLNEAAALLSGSQVQSPQFSGIPQVMVQAPDYAGGVGQNYSGSVSQANAASARQGANNGAMAGAGSAIAAAAIIAL